MARIRVDTEDLRSKAKDFESAAESISKAGDDILTTAMSLPSYDGQLSGPARSAGYEIQRQSRELQGNLKSDADSLHKTAQDFDRVNNETINVLGEYQSLLSDTNNSLILTQGPPPPTITIELNSDGSKTITTTYPPEIQADGTIITMKIIRNEYLDGTITQRIVTEQIIVFTEDSAKWRMKLDKQIGPYVDLLVLGPLLWSIAGGLVATGGLMELLPQGIKSGISYLVGSMPTLRDIIKPLLVEETPGELYQAGDREITRTEIFTTQSPPNDMQDINPPITTSITTTVEHQDGSESIISKTTVRKEVAS